VSVNAVLSSPPVSIQQFPFYKLFEFGSLFTSLFDFQPLFTTKVKVNIEFEEQSCVLCCNWEEHEVVVVVAVAFAQ